MIAAAHQGASMYDLRSMSSSSSSSRALQSLYHQPPGCCTFCGSTQHLALDPQSPAQHQQQQQQLYRQHVLHRGAEIQQIMSECLQQRLQHQQCLQGCWQELPQQQGQQSSLQLWPAARCAGNQHQQQQQCLRVCLYECLPQQQQQQLQQQQRQHLSCLACNQHQEQVPDQRKQQQPQQQQQWPVCWQHGRAYWHCRKQHKCYQQRCWHQTQLQQQDQQQQGQQQQCRQQTRLAGFSVLHLLVLLLSFLQAAAATPAAAAAAVPGLHDVLLPLPPGVYNPSLVVYQGSAWLVARSTQLKWDDTGLKWIINRAHLCQLNTTNWSVIRCTGFDPWRGQFGAQCRWGSPSWKVPWEAWGVDDTKIFRWPGRGVWALTGRRPQQPQDSIYCPQPVVWKQWLVQLAVEGQPLHPNAFDHPATDPPGVTWGRKPGSGSSSSSSSAGRHLLQAQTSNHQEAASGISEVATEVATEGARVLALTVTDSTSSVHIRRRQRRASASAADISINSSSSSSGGGAKPYGRYSRLRTGARRRYKQHTRPAFGSTTAGQPVGVHVLPAAAAAPLPAGLPPGRGDGSSSSSSSSGGSSSSEDVGWRAMWGKLPVPLVIADAKAVYGQQHSINEKNWMPFVWQGQLLVTYTLTPKHRVYQLRPDGLAEPKWESDPSAVFAPLGPAAAKLHGGPPLILVNFTQYAAGGAAAGGSATQAAYYLGVAHYWLPAGANKDGRTYHHFLIRLEAQPPFRVMQLSAELPVRYSAHYKRVAFVSGIELAMLPKQQQQQQQQQVLVPHVLISYGSGDWESHLAVLTLGDVDALFAAATAAAPSAGRLR